MTKTAERFLSGIFPVIDSAVFILLFCFLFLFLKRFIYLIVTLFLFFNRKNYIINRRKTRHIHIYPFIYYHIKPHAAVVSAFRCEYLIGKTFGDCCFKFFLHFVNLMSIIYFNINNLGGFALALKPCKQNYCG